MTRRTTTSRGRTSGCRLSVGIGLCSGTDLLHRVAATDRCHTTAIRKTSSARAFAAGSQRPHQLPGRCANSYSRRRSTIARVIGRPSAVWYTSSTSSQGFLHAHGEKATTSILRYGVGVCTPTGTPTSPKIGGIRGCPLTYVKRCDLKNGHRTAADLLRESGGQVVSRTSGRRFKSCQPRHCHVSGHR